MAELTVPQIDFSALGQLPDIYKKAQADNLRQQTLANLGQGGTADAQALLKSGDLSLAQLGINLQNRQEDQSHTSAREAVADAHQKFMEKIALRQAQRADDKTPTGFMEDPNNKGSYIAIPGGPADPKYLGQKAEVEAASNKPIPFETIGGTKFLVRGPNGSYTAVDPSSIGNQSQAAPQQTSFPAPLPGQSPPATAVPQSTVGPQSVAPAWAQPPQALGASAATPQTQTTAQPQDIEAVDPKTGRREGYLQSLDPQVRDYIKKVADYEIDPRTTSVKGGMREKLMSAVAKYDPTYNQNDFGARAKAIKDFSTGPQGNIVRSFDVAVDHLDTLQKAADAMKNGDVRALNAIRNAWREQTGSDLPTNFKSLVPLVSGEIAKAVIGSNNALSDREELRANLQAAQSPEQIAGVINSYKALMGGQLKGLKKQYEESTGKKDFNGRIRETTRRELEGGPKSEPGVTSTGVKWSIE